MSSGFNDYLRNTGALPKSNRCSNIRTRNGVRPSENCHTHFNERVDRVPIDLRLVSDRDTSRTSRTAKNSNARSSYSIPAVPFYEFDNSTVHYTTHQQNYAIEEFAILVKMSPPASSGVQSPPIVQGSKSTNVDKMPDRDQVEGRLNQIRDYIKVTTTMMDSLSQSSDPRAHTQHEKLSKMVEDLQDSETKLSKLCEDYEKHWRQIENGECGLADENREIHLRKKMEESQRNLVQLQEHQAHIVAMQLSVREKLQEARQAQQALLLEEKEGQTTPPSQEIPDNRAEQLEKQTAILRGKLAQLLSKKLHMDNLVAELQAVEMSDRGSSSSNNSRNVRRDKVAELDAMKVQISRLNTLMEQATRFRECVDGANSESEQEGYANIDRNGDLDMIEEPDTSTSYNSFNHTDVDENDENKELSSTDAPTFEQIKALTKELKEQQTLVMTARAELQRLRHSSMPAAETNQRSSSSCSIPPPILPVSTPVPTEKKQTNNFPIPTNNNDNDARQIQNKRKQLEDYMRKDQTHTAGVNQNGCAWPDWASRRGSNSHHSHNSTPANFWPPPSTDAHGNDNLLDIGTQPFPDSGYVTNWWEPPPASHVNQPQQGSTEYYRQLLLGSQSQQLQMMSTTIQQCCQLLWAQQRELQSMKVSMAQMQQQLQGAPKLENHCYQFSNSAESALPQSSSLPNLASLPNSTIVPPIPPQPIPPHVQHNQLNNQVPPGNRANNYWDNFRSYSRQNLLSATTKTVTDCATNTSTHPSSSAARGPAMNCSHVKDKHNKEHGPDNVPTSLESQYSSNLQLLSNLHQRPERTLPAARNNILMNDNPQPQQPSDHLWDENAHLLPANLDDDDPNVGVALRRILDCLVGSHTDMQPYLYKVLSIIAKISEHERLRNPLMQYLQSFASRLVFSFPNGSVALPSVSLSTLGYNEDLAEADQSRPETSNSNRQSSQQQLFNEENAIGNGDDGDEVPTQFY